MIRCFGGPGREHEGEVLLQLCMHVAYQPWDLVQTMGRWYVSVHHDEKGQQGEAGVAVLDNAGRQLGFITSTAFQQPNCMCME
jgi:hypothetical protein